MNRKIMLLPLAATVLCGLVSCGTGGNATSSSEAPTVYDGDISAIESGTDVTVSGLVAQVGSKGWVLDDGKASVYVYGTLGKEFKVGDHVNVAASCTGYWGLYELASATVTANDGNGPTLAAPTEITASELQTAWNTLNGSGEKEAKWKPTNSKRYKITGLIAEDLKGYAAWSIDGFDKKLSPYYYAPAYNVTEANRSTKLYAGCKYDVSFYIVGKNTSGNINMGIFDVTAHYETITGVTVTGDASVEANASTTLTSTVTPSSADHGVTWTSSDPNIATVDAYGKVTGVAEGSVTITATSTADNTKKFEWTMTVTKPSVAYSKVGSLSFGADSTVTTTDKLSEKEDPHVTYTSTEGVEITVRKGESKSDVKLWDKTDGHCRWYVKSTVEFKSEKDFDRIVLTCSNDKDDLGSSTVLPNDATMDRDSTNHIITITLASAVKSASITVGTQIRPTNVELQKGSAAA